MGYCRRNTWYYKWKPSKVILDFHDWEISLRELIFAFLIVGVMTFLGFLISSKIEKHVNDDILIYRQAASINTDDEFAHAINTDIGHAFAKGDLIAEEPVTNEHVPGEHLSVLVKHQEYRMHTQHYTTTDSKGHIHHHTRHYWSWDTMSTDEKHSKTVKYCGVSFPYDKFGYGNAPKNRDVYKHSSWSDKRDVIYTVPKKFNGTIFGNFTGQSIEGRPDIVRTSIDEYRKDLTTSHSTAIFWTLWIVFTIGVVIAFFVAENRWLEDCHE